MIPLKKGVIRLFFSFFSKKSLIFLIPTKFIRKILKNRFHRKNVSVCYHLSIYSIIQEGNHEKGNIKT